MDNEFIKWLEEQRAEEVGSVKELFAFNLACLLKKYNKERTHERKGKNMTLYVYGNVITLDRDYMDDYLYEKYSEDYKDIGRVEVKVEEAWEDVEEIENATMEQVYRYITDCYWMLEYNYKLEAKK